MESSKQQKKVQLREHSAGIVVFRELEGKRKYLILHYPGGHFDFAKGHLEQGESEKQAAIRELEEETGIHDIEIVDGFAETIVYYFRRQGKLIEKKVTFFVARTENSQVQISHEHQGYLWLEFEAALSKITFDNAKEILSKAEHFFKKQ